MAVSLVSFAAGGAVTASGVGSTTAQTMTAGNLLVVGCSCSLAPVVFSHIDDDAGNSWQPATGAEIVAAGNQVFFFYAENCLGQVNNVVRMHTNAVSSYNAIIVYEFSGVALTSALVDTDNGSGSGTAVSTSGALASGNLICGYAAAGGNSLAGSGGFTVNAFSITGDSTPYFAGLYQITAASVAATATCGSSSWVIGAASFAGAVAAGGHPTMRRWGGVPYLGGQGIGQKGGGGGRTWGRTLQEAA